VNLFDDVDDSQMVKSLLNKSKDWRYEKEYRMMITLNDVRKGLLSKDEFKQGLVKFQKEDLEGIVFGMRITYENAKLVYETIKKNYIDEGIVVKFYEAIEVKRQYKVKIEQIEDIDKYFDELSKNR
jgi:hypothetical protein